MSHGHDHSHGDPHAQAHAAATHGPVEIPAAPTRRFITPAPEDFENLPGPTSLAWPVLWMALAALLVGSLLCAGWPSFHDEHGAAGHEAEGHR